MLCSFRYKIAVGLMSFLVLLTPIIAENAWVPLNAFPYQGIDSFDFIDNCGPDTLWAVGNVNSTTRYLIKSTDGGYNWEFLQSFGIIYGIDFANAEIGFIISENSTVYKTSNAGNSWSVVYNAPYPLYNLIAINSSVIWVVGANSTVVKTEDGGQNWEQVTVPYIGDLDKIDAVDSNNIWVGRKYGGSIINKPFLKTTDGGQNWSELSMPDCQNFTLANSLTAYCARSFEVFKTVDGGENWTSLIETDLRTPSILSLSENYVWAVGNSYQKSILRTKDGGVTWNEPLYYETSSPNYAYDICAYDTACAWLASDILYKYTTNPKIELIYPNGGEVLGVGDKIQIKWKSSGISNIDIYFKADADDWQWIEIADTVTASSGYYFWEAPDLLSETCEIKITNSDQFYSKAFDVSESYFSIAELPVQYVSAEFYDNVTYSGYNTGNVFDRGIPIRMKIRVKNNQEQNLLTASGILRSLSPEITISDSIASFNNILANQNEISADEFEFVISPDSPDEFRAEFEIEISDQIVAGGPWTASFILPIVLDPFTVNLVVIDDDSNPDSQGDNDDIAEPGETIEIIPLLTNRSENEYNLVDGELTSIADYISIWDNQAGASGIVYSHYPYNVLSGSQEPVEAGQANIMPEQDFVFNYNGTDVYTIPFGLLVSANVTKYDNMEMRWMVPFELNEGQPINLTVSITSPAEGSQFQVGDVISITADASGVYGIQKVSFGSGTTLLGEDAEAPYEIQVSTSGFPQGNYQMTATAWDLAGNSVADAVGISLVNASGIADATIPSEFSVSNYPNPFNATTTFRYSLPEDSFVTLKIFTITGDLVNTLIRQTQSAGYYDKQWDACDKNGQSLASGIYYYQICTETGWKIRKLLLLK